MNILKIDLQNLIENHLSPDEYIFIKLLSTNDFDLISVLDFNIDIDSLEARDLIKTSGCSDISLFELTEKAYLILGITTNTTLDLSERFRNLFVNTKPGVLSPLQTIVTKLKHFKTLYPDYSDDTIMLAAQMYIDSCKSDNYKYMTQVSKFIIHSVNTVEDYSSLLANWCETAISAELNTFEDNVTKA